MKKRIKVFTIEDSPIFRQVLKDIITSDDELEYYGSASNGTIAIQKLNHIKPDIITLDIEMPEMDGLQTLKFIMENFPTPVLMVSSYTQKGADITLKALELGAVDYIEKPSHKKIKKNINQLEELLINKIKIFSNIKFQKKNKLIDISTSDELPVYSGLPSYDIPKVRTKPFSVICIGSSTGGTVALSKLLPAINENIGVPILIVQHMPPVYTNSFARRLNSLCGLKVIEVQGGESIEPNVVYIAQGNYHMVVENDLIAINNAATVNNHRPSVDVLFDSVEKYYQDRAMAVILTGMGSDGAKGLAKIKNSGGFTIAQDEDSSVIFGMPGSAIKTGKVDRVIPLDKLAAFINELIDFTRQKS